MAAAFPFTVSTIGRLFFLSRFMKSPDRRRKVVSDWMSFVMSIMLLQLKHLFRCYQNTVCKAHKSRAGSCDLYIADTPTAADYHVDRSIRVPLVPPYIASLKPYEPSRSVEEVERSYGVAH